LFGDDVLRPAVAVVVNASKLARERIVGTKHIVEMKIKLNQENDLSLLNQSLIWI
jgi:S-adenosylmethionine:tRNA-ribosyltransferase-isomerase (queuine synthetase)